MNNKKGGIGTKIILVLILMIASAIGGAYGYSVLDGKMAVKDARKDVESVRVSDYDNPESTEVQGLIDNVNKDLDTASSRKEVYELMEDFNTDISKIKTKTQKELEEARRAAEEAINRSNNNNNNNGNNYNSDDNSNYNNDGNSNNYDDSADYDNNNNYNNENNNNSGSSNSGESGSNSPITNDDGSSGKGGLLGNLLGGNSDE